MTERGFVIVLNVGIFVLLLVLVMEAAGMRRSLRRIEREERGLVHGQFKNLTDSTVDSLWQNATDGPWILVSPVPCATCRGPFSHRFFTKEGCEGASPSGTLRLTSSGRGKPKGLFCCMASAC
jgi:hypothetical protein